jgi:hypothetical protein
MANGKVYIGQSTNVVRRIICHKSLLKNGIHYNEYLQKAFQKHGEESFSFSVLCECEENELDLKERQEIMIRFSTDRAFGYNLESGGHENRFATEETKKKLSSVKKGVPKSLEWRAKLSARQIGMKRSQETRRKLSEKSRGNKNCLGRVISEEARKRMSDAMNKPEVKQRLSEIRKNYWANRRAAMAERFGGQSKRTTARRFGGGDE